MHIVKSSFCFLLSCSIIYKIFIWTKKKWLVRWIGEVTVVGENWQTKMALWSPNWTKLKKFWPYFKQGSYIGLLFSNFLMLSSLAVSAFSFLDSLPFSKSSRSNKNFKKAKRHDVERFCAWKDRGRQIWQWKHLGVLTYEKIKIGYEKISCWF